MASVEQKLCYAASSGRHREALSLLRDHPGIDVNLKDIDGNTPVSFACRCGHVSVVELLLKDPHVDITLDDNSGCTPLWHASWNGTLGVVEWLIASGRELGDVLNKKGKWCDQDYSALEIAQTREKTQVAFLLKTFTANPSRTRHKLRMKLGFADELAAEVLP